MSEENLDCGGVCMIRHKLGESVLNSVNECSADPPMQRLSLSRS